MKIHKKILAKNVMTELFYSTEPIHVYLWYQLNTVMFIYQPLNVKIVLMGMNLLLIDYVQKFQRINFVFRKS